MKANKTVNLLKELNQKLVEKDEIIDVEIDSSEDNIDDVKSEFSKNRYLGMIGIEKSDLPDDFRKKINAALGVTMEADLTSERLLSQSNTKVANSIISSFDNDENILYFIKSVSDVDDKNSFFIITNLGRIAKRVDITADPLQRDLLYVITDLDGDRSIDHIDTTTTAIAGMLDDNTLTYNYVHKIVYKNGLTGDSVISLGNYSSEDDEDADIKDLEDTETEEREIQAPEDDYEEESEEQDSEPSDEEDKK